MRWGKADLTNQIQAMEFCLQLGEFAQHVIAGIDFVGTRAVSCASQEQRFD